MDTSNQMFKFATIRNSSNKTTLDSKFQIQPETELTNKLVGILDQEGLQSEKLKMFNTALDGFLKSDAFFKTNDQVTQLKNTLQETKDSKEIQLVLKKEIVRLYDNIVVRTITKSNTNEVYKNLIDLLKVVYQKLEFKTIGLINVSDLKIVLPDGLVFSFMQAPKEQLVKENTTESQAKNLLEFNALLKEDEKLKKQLDDNALKIKLEQEKITKAELAIAHSIVRNPDSTSDEKKVNEKLATAPKQVSRVELNKLNALEDSINTKRIDLNHKIALINQQIIQSIPNEQYAFIGDRYVDVSDFVSVESSIENDAILVYSKGCHLKFPFFVADLRVVDQKTVGYVPAEIAHINNTQSGEKQERVTRRLKKVETFDSFISEDEVTKETDTQSTDKFSFERASSDVQAEETSVNVNASVSGSYGLVRASLDAGFSHSESSTNSNTASQSYAKEVVQKVVDRVSRRVKSERSVRSIEEFEETVTHVIDNSGPNDLGPKSYVYRWLTKLVRARLNNYGKRLIFQIDVPHPSSSYLSSTIKEESTVFTKIDPRTLQEFTLLGVNEMNYLSWGRKYNVQLEQPPIKTIVIGVADLRDQVLTIPDGYMATKAHIRDIIYKSGDWAAVQILIGREGRNCHLLPSSPSSVWERTTVTLDNEEKQLPIAFLSPYGVFKATIEIECTLTDRASRAWSVKCYDAIVEGYENLKAEAEAEMSSFNPNNPGLSPDQKTALIQEELKKGALTKMFRCNPFWINDTFEVSEEYHPNCCADMLNAEKVRFLENTFDWKNMTYELHPYFYSNQSTWSGLQKLTDSDPHFESFLKSSFATLRIPVFRDSEKEAAAINFIHNNSIANHAVISANMQHLLEDLETNTPFGFIDETETTIPFVVIKKEYSRTGQLTIYYVDDNGTEVICNEVTEFDKEGNQTVFYYNTATGLMVISEIKDGINADGKLYNYYFNSENEKIITHRTKNEYDIEGNSVPYYSTDLGIFNIPTDLVILEAGVQDGVEVRGYPEDTSAPSTDIVIPKQYSPAIIKKD